MAENNTRSSLLIWFVVAGLVLIGIGIRLYDLTDQPIDFHPTRQLRGAIIARGLYYQMLPEADPAIVRQAVNFQHFLGKYEPPLLETLVAWTYLPLGGENLWVANIYSALFWIIGGLALFDLARRIASPPGAILTIGYYLLLPFAAQASRAFQPDPAMVMCIILAVYSLYRWAEKPAWKWALLAGIFGGVAILTKAVAAFVIAAAAVALVLAVYGWKRFWRQPQVWVIALLMILPPALYYLVGSGNASDFLESRTTSFSRLLVDAEFYMRWFSTAQGLVGLAALLLAWVGVGISQGRKRIFLVALWVGYLAYGLAFNYYMITHSYYHLQLIPIVALSLAPVGDLLYERIRQQSRLWQAAILGMVILCCLYLAGLSILDRDAEDYRAEPAYWQEIGSYLPPDGRIIALTQDYGLRMIYYGWRGVSMWPPRGELKLSSLRGNDKKFEEYFAKKAANKSYFLITAFKQFEDQPALQEYLNEHYPILVQGDGYLIYDLRQTPK